MQDPVISTVLLRYLPATGWGTPVTCIAQFGSASNDYRCSFRSTNPGATPVVVAASRLIRRRGLLAVHANTIECLPAALSDGTTLNCACHSTPSSIATRAPASPSHSTRFPTSCCNWPVSWRNAGQPRLEPHRIQCLGRGARLSVCNANVSATLAPSEHVLAPPSAEASGASQSRREGRHCRRHRGCVVAQSCGGVLRLAPEARAGSLCWHAKPRQHRVECDV